MGKTIKRHMMDWDNIKKKIDYLLEEEKATTEKITSIMIFTYASSDKLKIERNNMGIQIRNDYEVKNIK
jgi:hypothetical protein